MSTPTRWSRARAAALVGAAALAVASTALVGTAQSSSAANGPAVTVTPASGLNPAGASVTVSGSGFATAGSGIYVGIADQAKYSPTNADVFGVVKWLHLGATPSSGQDVLNPDGSFTTTLNVAATFGTGANATNCQVASCAIYTLAAHGSSDRSQDTMTPVSFGPAIALSAASNLSSGQSVTVDGAGYQSGKGIYVAQTVAKPASGYPSAYGNARWISAVGADGTFSQAVTVTDTFTPRGGSPVDCRVVQCYLATFNDHTDINNRSQDVFVPIGFAAAEPTMPSTSPATTPSTSPATTPSTTSTAQPSGLAVQVSPTSGLALEDAVVTVSGSGFATSGSGIYVGIASRAKYNPANADVFGAVKWVHLGATPSSGQDVLNPDGSFSTTLTVDAVFGTGATATDCRVEQCAVYTLAAHGSSDRSQDTATNVSFVGAPNPSASTSSSAGAPSGSVSLSVSSVRPGGSVTLTASGFTAGEQVQAILHSTPVDLGISPAGADGRFTLTFAVPSDLEPGAHTVTLTGLTSALALTASLQVSAAGSGDPATVLASTGVSLGGPLGIGVLLLVAGGLLLAVAAPRRRRARH